MNNNKYNQTHNNDIKRPYTEGEFTRVMIRDTAKFREKYGFEVGSNGSAWNNESDAFRHAYMQAYLTLRYNDFVAEQLGKYHEIDGNINNNQDRAEETMDLHNNYIGREIGNEIKNEHKNESINPDTPEIKEIMARKVAERMQAGKLILDPSGRKTPKKKLNIPGVNNEINSGSKCHSQKGCVGSYKVRTCGAKHAGMSIEERLAGQAKYKGKKFQDIPQYELEDAISYFI